MWILPRVFFFTLEAAKLAVLPETSQQTLQLPQMIMKPIGAAIILTILRTKLDYKSDIISAGASCCCAPLDLDFYDLARCTLNDNNRSTEIQLFCRGRLSGEKNKKNLRFLCFWFCTDVQDFVSVAPPMVQENTATGTRTLCANINGMKLCKATTGALAVLQVAEGIWDSRSVQ